MIRIFTALFLICIACPTAQETADKLLAERHFLFSWVTLFSSFLYVFLFIFGPVEETNTLLYLFILSCILDWLTIMQVVKTMFHAQVHGAFRTLKIIDIGQLGFASFGLAVGGTTTFTCELLPPPFILF